MTIYWSFSKVPELSTRNQAEREIAIKRVNSLTVKTLEWWVALLIAGALTGAGAWLGGTGISGALGAGIGAAVGGLIHHVVVIYTARKYYSSVLAGHSDA